MAGYRTEIAEKGFAVISRLFTPSEVGAMARAIEEGTANSDVRKRKGVYAIRNLLQSLPGIAAVAESRKVSEFVRGVLGDQARPVRGILFDKTAYDNWLVPWHQDLTISVNRRADLPGYGPWSTKAGVIHVQPPVAVLKEMLAIRIHLDDCDETNGPLRVLPGTHRLGRLSGSQIAHLQKEIPFVTCTVRSGGAVLMRPLLLHASSVAAEPRRRRVVHLEFANADLPVPLAWLGIPDPAAKQEIFTG